MLSFEDIYPKYSASGFSCTNEIPQPHRDLLKGEKLGRTLAIASGGEMTFFVLLPKVRGKIVCVDHSYRSLIVFYLKVLMMEQLGCVETKRLLSSREGTTIRSVADRLSENLPPVLKAVYDPMAFKDKCGNPNYYYASSHPFNDSVCRDDLHRRWTEVPLKVLEVSARKLHQIILVHGDVRDVEKYGPYTHAYLSNALEHPTREHSNLSQKAVDVIKALGPNCKVLATTQYGPFMDSPLWNVHRTAAVKPDVVQGTRWNYSLIEGVLPPPPPPQQMPIFVD